MMLFITFLMAAQSEALIPQHEWKILYHSVAGITPQFIRVTSREVLRLAPCIENPSEQIRAVINQSTLSKMQTIRR